MVSSVGVSSVQGEFSFYHLQDAAAVFRSAPDIVIGLHRFSLVFPSFLGVYESVLARLEFGSCAAAMPSGFGQRRGVWPDRKPRPSLFSYGATLWGFAPPQAPPLKARNPQIPGPRPCVSLDPPARTPSIGFHSYERGFIGFHRFS